MATWHRRANDKKNMEMEEGPKEMGMQQEKEYNVAKTKLKGIEEMRSNPRFNRAKLDDDYHAAKAYVDAAKVQRTRSISFFRKKEEDKKKKKLKQVWVTDND